MTTYKKLETAAIIFAGIVFGVALLMVHTGHNHAEADESIAASSQPQQFDSKHVGIAFAFPAGYGQALNHINEGEDNEYHQVVLSKMLDSSGIPTTTMDGEVPPQITISGIDVAGSTDLEQWVKTDKRSNFALSADQKLTPTTVGGEPALSYHYSGLYENDSVAVKHGEKIFVFNVSWIGATDQIRTDFDAILKEISYTAPTNSY